jgi:hypothetical protein
VQVSTETGFRLSYEDLDDTMGLVVGDDPTVQGFLADAAMAARVRRRIEGGRPTRPLLDGGIANTGSPPSSATWFQRNHVEPALVERAAQHIYAFLDPKAALELAERSRGDRQFAVWLHLTDEHRTYLSPSAPSLEGTDWRRLYEGGKSPYEAVTDAWERSEERRPAYPVRLTAEDLDRLTRRGVEVSIRDEDKRFTFGLVIDAAGVLRKHGYPVLTHGEYDTGEVLREIGQALWRLLYRDTNLGIRPALGQREAGVSPEPGRFGPPRRGVER